MVRDLPALTSFRFIAAFLIVIQHTKSYFPWSPPGGYPYYGQGVTFFFVLSGFILTHVYSTKRVSYGQFMLARVARLWPVHAATLALVLLLIPKPYQTPQGEGFFSPLVTFWFNLTLTQSLVPYYEFVFSWNAPSWSISTEMFFYLMFPFLLRNIEKTWHVKLLLFLLLIAIYWIIIKIFGLSHAPDSVLHVGFMTYASPLFRGFEFALGMSAYLGWKRVERWKLSGFAWNAIEVSAIALVIWWGVWGIHLARELTDGSALASQWHAGSASCLVCAVLIVAFAGGRGYFSQELGRRSLVYLGEISFALYMVHQVVIRWIYIQTATSQFDPVSPLTLFVCCLLGAVFLHHAVERPGREVILWASAHRTVHSLRNALLPRPRRSEA